MKKGKKNQKNPNQDLFDIKPKNKVQSYYDFLDQSQKSAIEFLAFQPQDFLLPIQNINELSNIENNQQDNELAKETQLKDNSGQIIQIENKKQNQNNKNINVQKNSKHQQKQRQDSELSFEEYKIIFKQMLSDFSEILQSSFDTFWATLKFNSHFKKSLDSFLRFATKPIFNSYIQNQSEHVNIHIHNSTQISQNQIQQNTDILNQQKYESLQQSKPHILLQQLYHVIFLILHRMACPNEENMEKCKAYDCFTILFDNWLLDMPKFFEIIAIYGSDQNSNHSQRNSKQIRHMIHNVLNQNQQYLIEFKNNDLKSTAKEVNKILNEFRSQNKRSNLQYDSVLSKDEETKRLQVLYFCLDVSSTFSNFFDYFPESFCDGLVFHEQLPQFIENMFYYCKEAKKVWIFTEENERFFIGLLNQVMSNVVDFITKMFEHMNRGLKSSRINSQHQGDLIQIKLSTIINNFGEVLTEKQAELNKNYELLELVQRRFDVMQFFSTLPKFLQFNEQQLQENFMLFQASLSSLIDEHQNKLLRKKSAAANNQNQGDNAENQKQIEEERQDQVICKAGDFASEYEMELSDYDYDDEEADFEELQLNKFDDQGKIKYSDVYYKKEKAEPLQLSEDARKQMALVIKQQMSMQDEYEDEFDDTQQQVYRNILVDKRPDSGSSSTSSSGGSRKQQNQQKNYQTKNFNQDYNKGQDSDGQNNQRFQIQQQQGNIHQQKYKIVKNTNQQDQNQNQHQQQRNYNYNNQGNQQYGNRNTNQNNNFKNNQQNYQQKSNKPLQIQSNEFNPSQQGQKQQNQNLNIKNEFIYVEKPSQNQDQSEDQQQEQKQKQYYTQKNNQNQDQDQKQGGGGGGNFQKESTQRKKFQHHNKKNQQRK